MSRRKHGTYYGASTVISPKEPHDVRMWRAVRRVKDAQRHAAERYANEDHVKHGRATTMGMSREEREAAGARPKGNHWRAPEAMVSPGDWSAGMKQPHPSTTPLDHWPRAWLVLEVASLLEEPLYIVMSDDEKRAAGYPLTDIDMRAFILAAGRS